MKIEKKNAGKHFYHSKSVLHFVFGTELPLEKNLSM